MHPWGGGGGVKLALPGFWLTHPPTCRRGCGSLVPTHDHPAPSHRPLSQLHWDVKGTRS